MEKSTPVDKNLVHKNQSSPLSSSFLDNIQSDFVFWPEAGMQTITVTLCLDILAQNSVSQTMLREPLVFHEKISRCSQAMSYNRTRLR